MAYRWVLFTYDKSVDRKLKVWLDERVQTWMNDCLAVYIISKMTSKKSIIYADNEIDVKISEYSFVCDSLGVSINFEMHQHWVNKIKQQLIMVLLWVQYIYCNCNNLDDEDDC